MQHNKFLLGAHMSIAGGFEKAISRGESIGCSVIQIFTKSNRQWFAKPIDQKAASAFKKALSNSSIVTVVAHAAYLINIGSSNSELRTKSTNALIDELQRCEQLNIPYLVIHPGAKGDATDQQCLRYITEHIEHAHENVSGNKMILSETRP